MKIGRIAAAAAAVAVAAFVIVRFASSKQTVVETDNRPSVRIDKPTNRDITIYTEQIGTIEPTQSVSVFPKMGGEVLSVNFEAGDAVNAGDILVTINSDALTSLKIQVDTAKVVMDDAVTALGRTQALADTGAVSVQALEQAGSAATSARLSYEAAKSQYDLQASYTGVKAPISGIVETKTVEVHDMLSGSTPVAVISSNEGVQVKFGATSDVQRVLKEGDTITATANGTEYTGTVTEISNVVSAATGLYEAKARLEAADSLQTGTRVKLTLLKNHETGALCIPLSAVSYAGNNPFVYVYDGGKAVKKDIKVGLYDSEFIAVDEGLSGTESVITTWSNEIYDGAEVVLADDMTENTGTPNQAESKTTGEPETRQE